MRTIAVANQKGGCGKTTVSINLAAALADLGHRTLLVDMDPQGHCAVGLGVPEADIKHAIHDLLTPPETSRPSLADMVWQIGPNFDLLPSTLQLAKVEPAIYSQANRENRLRDALEASRPNYDFIIVDCPPGLGLLTFNGLCAADEVLIPVEAGYFSLHGLGRQLEVVEGLQSLTQRALGIRVLCNLYDVRTRASRKIVAQLREHFGDMMTKTVVNLNTKLKAAAAVGQPITEFDRSSIGFHDFIDLARELAASPAAAEPVAVAAAVGEKVELLSQAQSISDQAEQLLQASEQLIAGSVADRIEAAVEQKREAMTLDEKLEAFYGYRQMADGVAFAAEAPDAERVCVAGDFNNWSPYKTPLARQTDGRWLAKVDLSPGTHRYRFIVDGRWTHDRHNEHREANPFGELNSIAEVK